VYSEREIKNNVIYPGIKYVYSEREIKITLYIPVLNTCIARGK